MVKQTGKWLDGQTDRQTDKWLDGKTERQTWLDGWTQTDRQRIKKTNKRGTEML